MRLTLMGSRCVYLAALAEHADNSREAVKPDSDEREALAISVDSVAEIWPGSYPVDFVQCKYRSEEMFYGCKTTGTVRRQRA